jgi:hypothetical protein
MELRLRLNADFCKVPKIMAHREPQMFFQRGIREFSVFSVYSLWLSATKTFENPGYLNPIKTCRTVLKRITKR